VLAFAEYSIRRLADVEAGGLVPEAEARRDLGARQIVGALRTAE
jgi:hypothetical protein